MIEVHIKKDERENKKSFIEENIGSILTSIVALAAVLVSFFQFQHSKQQAEIQRLLTERSYVNDSIKNERDFLQKKLEYNDSRKQALTKLILENEKKLLSKEQKVRETFLNILTGTYGEESYALISILNNLSNNHSNLKDDISLSKDIQLVKNNIDNLKRQKIEQFYKPLNDGFEKGKILYKDYTSSNYSYRVAKEIYDNNKQLLELLVGKSSFIPDYLLEDRQFLIEHLSLWTSAFEKQSSENKPSDISSSFRVFYSGRTYPFLSAQRFTNEYIKLVGS